MRLSSWFSQKNSVKGATSILIVTLTISNLLGALRDHYLAQKIPTDLLDTYYAAFRIPDLIFNILILGAVSSAFIPVFSRYLIQKRDGEANQLASSIATVGMSGIVIIVILTYLFLPSLIPIIVPSFSLEKQQLTLTLSRFLLFSPLFFGISYFLSALLNSYKRFLVTSLAPLLYNLSIIVSTILLSEKYGVYAIGWGVVTGAFLHMLIQFIPIKSLGIRLRFIWDTSSSSIKEVGRLMLPRSIGLGAMQILLLAFTAIASGLGPGSVAIFALADNIQTMPTVVFGTSISSALFPTLAESYSLGKLDDFNRYLEKAVISILFLLVPASVGVILLRIQIVRLVLGSGQFGWEQTVITSQVLGFFALSLVFSGLIPLFSRAFYALHNTRIPTYYAIITVFISIIIGYFATDFLGVSGLALAFSIGSLINCLLLYFALRKKLPEFNETVVWSSLTKIIIASSAMAISIQITKIAIGTLYDLSHFIEVAAQAGIAIAIGGAVYFAVTHVLGLTEVDLFGLNRLLGYFTGGNGENGKENTD